jgi:hypothetical protein
MHSFTPETERFLRHFFILSHGGCSLATLAELQLVTFVNFGCDCAYATIAADNFLPSIPLLGGLL